MIELLPERAAPHFRGRRRVLVLGNCGSGKSSLSRRLAPRLGLPLVHLDVEYWRPAWTAPSDADWDRAVAELVAADRWLMDGNFARTLPLRLARADAAVLLDLPVVTCLARAVHRALLGEDRADLAEGCRERLSGSFFRYVWEHPRRAREEVLVQLEEFSTQAPVACLRDGAQVERFLSHVADAP